MRFNGHNQIEETNDHPLNAMACTIVRREGMDMAGYDAVVRILEPLADIAAAFHMTTAEVVDFCNLPYEGEAFHTPHGMYLPVQVATELTQLGAR